MPHVHIQHGPGLLATVARRTVAVAAVLAIALSALVSSGKPAQAATSLTSIRSSVITLTNVARATKGCKPLKPAKKLRVAAQRHANDMAAKNYFGHTSSNGTSWVKRIRNAGWQEPGGENIAYGFVSASGVLKGWMSSPGHRRNIMDCNFRYIGVGFNSVGNYWVQDFGY